MIKEERKFIDSTLFEGMTSIRAVISAIDERISDRTITKILYDKGRIAKNAKEIGYFKAVSTKYGFELIETTAAHLDEITLGTSHGGVCAYCTERTYPKLCASSDIKPHGFYAIIEGIEDPYNFGYALRSLYACGCDGIILPMRNWLTAAGVVCRSSAGASERFSFYQAETQECINIFKERSYTVACADTRTDNILGATPLLYPLLLVVGGEKRGISRKTLDLCDVRVKINYAREFSASLSAASATTMFAYEIMRQNTGK